jgi:hypothetical protein
MSERDADPACPDHLVRGAPGGHRVLGSAALPIAAVPTRFRCRCRHRAPPVTVFFSFRPVFAVADLSPDEKDALGGW